MPLGSLQRWNPLRTHAGAWGVAACLLITTRVGATPLLLEQFGQNPGKGRVISGSSWEQGVQRLPASLILGEGVRDDNGWQADGLNLDATGMSSVAITGRRLPGNAATSFVVEFQDANLNTALFSAPMASFSAAGVSTIHIPIRAWSPGFDYARIVSWSVGGGSPPPGAAPLRLELVSLELSPGGGPLVETLPKIISQPAHKIAASGASVTLEVVARGTPAPTFQWRKDGIPVLGATRSSLVIAVNAASVGRYAVAVTNPVGSILSQPAVLSLEGAPQVASGSPAAGIGLVAAPGGSGFASVPAPAPGTQPALSAAAASPRFIAGTTSVSAVGSGTSYFGSWSTGGSWAIFLRPDQTGVFLAHFPEERIAALGEFRLGTDRSATAVASLLAPRLGTPTAAAYPPDPAAAPLILQLRLEGERAIGTFRGHSLQGLPDTGPASVAGLYRGRALYNATGDALILVGASGRFLAVAALPETIEGASGQLKAADGVLAGPDEMGPLQVSLQPAAQRLTLALTPPGAQAPVQFIALVDHVLPTSALANLSIRTLAGVGDQSLIAGFAVSGGAKSILVRGIGPTLGTFGVSGAIRDPRLELRPAGRGTLLAANDDWHPADSEAFVRVGAFALPRGSRDAALLTSLAPDSYTASLAEVGERAAGSGVALVEIYDADSTGPGRLTNVSARSEVGTGGDVLIAGFNLHGIGTRRLLIRAIGPGLEEFGIGDALADPRLDLFAAGSSTPLATNNDWAAALAPVFAQVGAFPLRAGSWDAALLVTLPPGSFTAQVSGVGDSRGVALIEIYEVD
jgi:hypothetical protein